MACPPLGGGEMKFSSLGAAVVLAAGSASAQPAAQPPRGDLSAMNDEFNATTLDKKWARYDQRYGWPNKLKRFDVHTTTAGALHMEPFDSAGVRDRTAPYLFQTVEGDFDVRARLRVRGAGSDTPAGTWSLGGLMARVPNGLDAKTWEPRRENWHFITTGVGLERGRPVTETKGTYNSYSSLKLRPFQPGWVELRLVRVGMTLFALARPDGAAQWQLRDRFYRMESSPYMQVGLTAYTTSDDVAPGPEDAGKENRTVQKDPKVDMQMDVDWVRFSRPKPRVDWDWQSQVREHPLADPNLAEAK